MINLKKLIKRKDVVSVVCEVASIMDSSTRILDVEDNILFSVGMCENGSVRFPVKPNNKLIGWVEGGEDASALASVLSCIAYKELENDELAKETLYRYKELVLLHSTAEKITTNFVLSEVGELIIEEALKLIEADNVTVMLLNGESGHLETVSTYGNEDKKNRIMKSGEGIEGDIFLKGTPEIINDVKSDPRFIDGENKVISMMCAPLKTVNGAIGVITISSERSVCYTSVSLNLFNTLALHSSIAIENARYIEELEGHRENLEGLVSERTKELAQKNRILKKQLDEIKTLRGLLPVCANCRKIRDDGGYWKEMEVYFEHNSELEFSHGICPDCVRELYPECADEILNKIKTKQEKK